MAATIQHIELPKKPRALDSSTSVQEVSQEILANVGLGSSGTINSSSYSLGWVDETNSGEITIASNQLVFTNASGAPYAAAAKASNGSNLLVLTSGNTYSLTYEVISVNTGGVDSTSLTIVDGASSISGNPITVGTHTVTFVARGSNLVVRNDTENSILTLDNLSLKQVETFSNNNHGKIYSGRGLEFDGVTDHLTAPLGNLDASVSTSWAKGSIGSDNIVTNATGREVPLKLTSCVWVRLNAVGKSQFIQESGGGEWGIKVESSNKITVNYLTDNYGVDSSNDSASATGTKVLEANTWYRVVVNYNMQEGAAEDVFQIYINGVLDPLSTSSELGSTGTRAHKRISPDHSLRIGSYGNGESSLLDGALSDYQVWFGNFTADDAAYDYANPESLALNASGTALTESNLKIWYPMQDGHRGQQSYILDGANTGPVDEKIVNGDFSTSGTLATDSYSLGWSLGHADDQGVSITNGELVLNKSGEDGNYARAYATNGSSTSLMTIGQSYKLTYTVSGVTGAPNLLYYNGGYVGNIDETVGTHSYVFTQHTNTIFILKNNTTGTAIKLSNVSVKAINDKHNATTVFYGDELVTNGEFTNNITDGWTVNTTRGSYAHDAGRIKITNNAAGSYPNCSQDIATVIGRTYRVRGGVEIGTATTVEIRAVRSGDNASQQLSADGNIDFTFVADQTSTKLLCYLWAPTGNTAEYVFFDNISFQEVGVASGWTDADQQLDIAQPALQSYNELAWFDGAADHAVVSDHNDLSFDPMSISAWVNMNDATDFPIIGKGVYNSTAEYQLKVQSDDKIHFWVADESESSCHIGRVTPTITTQENKWIHVVGTYSGGTTSSGLKIYINGVQSDDANDEAAAASFVAMENLGADVYIGRYSNTYANGCVTETSLWDKELSSTEVLELFNDGKALDALTHSATANIKGYWRNNGLSTWTDLSTNSNDGIVATRVTGASYNNGTTITHTANSSIAVGMAVDGDGIPDGAKVASITDSTHFELSVSTTNGAKTGKALHLTRLSGETLLIPQGVDGSRDTQGFIMNKPRDTSSLNLPVDKSFAYTTRDDLNTKSYVEIQDHSGLDFGDGNFSMECWVKPSYRWKGSSSLNTIISLGGEVNASDSGGIVATSTTLNGYVGGVSTGTSFTAGEWHHIVLAREGVGSGEVKLYKNGTQANATTSNTTITNALNVTIGGGANLTRGYEDLIDGVKIYNKALSATEVLRNYKATKGSHRN